MDLLYASPTAPYVGKCSNTCLQRTWCTCAPPRVVANFWVIRAISYNYHGVMCTEYTWRSIFMYYHHVVPLLLQYTVPSPGDERRRTDGRRHSPFRFLFCFGFSLSPTKTGTTRKKLEDGTVVRSSDQQILPPPDSLLGWSDESRTAVSNWYCGRYESV